MIKNLEVSKQKLLEFYNCLIECMDPYETEPPHEYAAQRDHVEEEARQKNHEAVFANMIEEGKLWSIHGDVLSYAKTGISKASDMIAKGDTATSAEKEETISLLDKAQNIIMHRTMFHKCHQTQGTSYCWRKDKCRFGYPKQLCNKSTIEISHGIGGGVEVNFVPKRNQCRLSPFFRPLLVFLGANTDLQVVSTEKIHRYIAKYISKGESASFDFSCFLTTINRNVLQGVDGTEAPPASESTSSESIPMRQVTSTHQYVARALLHPLTREKSSQECTRLILSYKPNICYNECKSIQTDKSTSDYRNRKCSS
jgi:hypothetical protein